MTNSLRKFGLIGTSIWQSDRFTSLEALDTRLSYLWLHTSGTTRAGVLRFSPAHLYEEVDFIETLDRAGEVFCELVGAELIMWQRPYIIINKYLKFNRINSFRHAVGAFNEALTLPDCDTKGALMNELVKQQGYAKIREWRDKFGEPHELLFAIGDYFDAEALNPSETLQISFKNPSSKRKRKIKNKKVEAKPPQVGSIASIDGQHSMRLPGSLGQEGNTKDTAQAGPMEATKRSSLVLGMKR